MGTPGIVLRKKDKIVFEEVWNTTVDALNKTGYLYYCSHIQGIYLTHTISVCENEDEDSEKCFLMYVDGESEDMYDDDFDWIEKGARLNKIIYIENISNREDMALNFIKEYLKMNPSDIFWTGYDWYYTSADIERIASKEFNWDWCYDNPKDS